MAEKLEVTDNAVRPHLVMLERDGLVRQMGIKQSGGKPSHIFELTQEAEQLFTKSYGLLLSYFLSESRAALDDEAFQKLLGATARRLARRWPPASGNKLSKIEAGVAVLNDLGGLAEVSKEMESYFIQGYSCPLAEVTKDHPEVCYLAQVLLEELTGLTFERCCSYGDKPKCRFQVMEKNI